jgi:hypothetical protein
VLLQRKGNPGGFKELYAEAEARLAEVIAYQKMGVQIDIEYFWYDYQKWMKDYQDKCKEEDGRKVFMPRHDVVEAIVDSIIAALPKQLRHPTCETFCPRWQNCRLPRRRFAPQPEMEQPSLFSGALLEGLRETLNAGRKTTRLDSGVGTASRVKLPNRSETEISHQLLWRQSELLAALAHSDNDNITGYGCLKKGVRFLRSYLEWAEATGTHPQQGVSAEDRYEEMLEVLQHCFISLGTGLGKGIQVKREQQMPLGLLLENEIPEMLEGVSRLLGLMQDWAVSYFVQSGLNATDAKTRLTNDMGSLSRRLLDTEKAGPYWNDNQDILRDIAIILKEAVDATVGEIAAKMPKQETDKGKGWA